MRGRFPRGLCAALVGGLLLLGGRPYAAEMMTVGYQGRVTDSDVGRDDIRIAVEMWAREVTASFGSPVEPQLRFFESLELVELALANGELDVLTLSTIDFLQLRQRGVVDLRPSLVAGLEGSHTWRLSYVLLARADAGAPAVERLRGKRIVVVDPVGRSSVQMLWLEQLARDECATTPPELFAEISRVADPSTAILSVLFGQNDAAVVSRNSFVTMGELNPQIIGELAVLAQSEGMLVAVTCIPGYVDSDRRESIIEGALRLHEAPKGRQILTLFGTSSVIRYEAGFLRTVESLVGQSVAE